MTILYKPLSYYIACFIQSRFRGYDQYDRIGSGSRRSEQTNFMPRHTQLCISVNKLNQMDVYLINILHEVLRVV